MKLNVVLGFLSCSCLAAWCCQPLAGQDFSLSAGTVHAPRFHRVAHFQTQGPEGPFVAGERDVVWAEHMTETSDPKSGEIQLATDLQLASRPTNGAPIVRPADILQEGPDSGVVAASYGHWAPAQDGCSFAGAGFEFDDGAISGDGGEITAGFVGHRSGAASSGDGCCTPRWFDVYVGGIRLSRDNDIRNPVGIASENPLGLIVLESDDADQNSAEDGLQLTLQCVIGPGTNLEIDYFGLSEWADTHAVTDADTANPNSLYSVFSEFGELGSFGFPDTDQSNLQSITYLTKLHNVEINKRQRWISPNCRWQGSYLCGLRYFRVDEDFVYITEAAEHSDPFDGDALRGPGRFAYAIETTNDLVGPQVGSELTFCLLPRVRLGADAKAGIFVLRAQQKSHLHSHSGSEIYERVAREDLAGVGEFGLFALLQLSSRATLRVGYKTVFVQNVALAPEQFNPTTPSAMVEVPESSRVPFLETNGTLLLEGFTAGVELTW